MIRKIITYYLLLLPLFIKAQQQPYYTQYILNNYIINPALAGIENYWDIKASYRNQWVGLDGAPVTSYLTIQGTLKKNDYDYPTPTTVHAAGVNLRGKEYWTNYEAPPAHQGIGLTIINDKTGPLNHFSGYFTYAYHLPVGSKTSLSAGVSLGIQQTSLDAKNLDFGSLNPVDPAIAGSGYLNKLTIDMNAGLWLCTDAYFIGLAAKQIIPQKIGFGNESTGADSVKLLKGKLIPHIFLQAGYKFFIDDDFSILPSITLKYINPVPVSFDLNAKLLYQDLLWIGGSYRYKEGFSAMLGINISSTINIGYAYELTITKLNTVSYGTHEILIGFLLGNRYGDSSPRNIW